MHDSVQRETNAAWPPLVYRHSRLFLLFHVKPLLHYCGLRLVRLLAIPHTEHTFPTDGLNHKAARARLFTVAILSTNFQYLRPCPRGFALPHPAHVPSNVARRAHRCHTISTYPQQ